jgi:flagellar assembly factor FliW
LLILTRRIGEGVIIGDNIRVVVLEVRGKQIRLGIEAPIDVVVLRDEIFQRLTQENIQAANFELGDLRTFLKSNNGKVVSGFMPAEAPTEAQPEDRRLTIDSTKFGAIQVPEDQIITFSSGLLGLNSSRRFVLLSRPGPNHFYLLQGVDRPDVSLLLAKPSSLVDEYHMGRLNSALGELKARNPEDLQVFVTLTIPAGRPDDATANMVSPILINPQHRLGKQVVLESPSYSHKYRLMQG